MTPEWPENELERLDRCPVCTSPGRQMLYRDLRSTAGPGGWTLWECEGCGSGYIDPRPTAGSIGRLYETYYTHEAGGDEAPAPSSGLRTRMRDGYLAARFGYDERERRLGRLTVPLIPGGRGMVGQYVRSLPAPQPGMRLLDVGCANGAYLARMRELGWEVEGLEVDPAAAEVARGRGIPVHGGPMTPDAFPRERFDAVTLSHVIEHLHDPVAVLRSCAGVLRPGGGIWIAAPNLQAIGRKVFGPSWAGLDPPRHLVLFTRSSLRSALARAGFVEIDEPPPTLQAARWTFAASADIGGGGDGHTLAPLPAALKARAVLADLATVATRSASEELCMTAVLPRARAAGGAHDTEPSD